MRFLLQQIICLRAEIPYIIYSNNISMLVETRKKTILLSGCQLMYGYIYIYSKNLFINIFVQTTKCKHGLVVRFLQGKRLQEKNSITIQHNIGTAFMDMGYIGIYMFSFYHWTCNSSISNWLLELHCNQQKHNLFRFYYHWSDRARHAAICFSLATPGENRILD